MTSFWINVALNFKEIVHKYSFQHILDVAARTSLQKSSLVRMPPRQMLPKLETVSTMLATVTRTHWPVHMMEIMEMGLSVGQSTTWIASSSTYCPKSQVNDNCTLYKDI